MGRAGDGPSRESLQIYLWVSVWLYAGKLGALDFSERVTEIINWEPMDLGESDCLIKTKQRESLAKV